MSATLMSSRFGELRSLMHSTRGKARWSALVRLLETWPQEHLEQVVLPYLQDMLRDDPSPRYAPEHWRSIDAGEVHVHPAWPLSSALDMYNSDLGDEGAYTLAHSPHMANLTHLNLWNASIKVDGIRALIQSPQLAHLRVLNLGGNMFGDEGAAALAQSLRLPQLTSLGLAWNAIGPTGAAALAQSELLANLNSLDLETNQLGEGVHALKRSPYLSKLTTLKL